MSDMILMDETEALIPMGTWIRQIIDKNATGVIYGYAIGHVYEFNPNGGSDDTAWPMAKVNFFDAPRDDTLCVRNLLFFIDEAWVHGEDLHPKIIATAEAKGWQRWGA